MAVVLIIYCRPLLREAALKPFCRNTCLPITEPWSDPVLWYNGPTTPESIQLQRSGDRHYTVRHNYTIRQKFPAFSVSKSNKELSFLDNMSEFQNSLRRD